MKAIEINDLRCGNTLLYETGEQAGVLEATIDWQDLKWLAEDKKGFNLVHTPIPLTEEWLLRLGLRKLSCSNPTFDIDCKEKGSYTLSYTDYESESIENYWRIDLSNNGVYRYVRVDYVHQLQNLYYALTGQELTTTPK